MKICVISDSHGRRDRISEVLKRHSDIDLLIHAGDHADDLLDYKGVAFKSVCGNCDAPDSAPAEERFEITGVKVLVTHGHLFKVKQTLLPLMYRAKEVKANLVIFGHSHVPLIVEEEGILFLNPGSLSYPRGKISVPTYGILDILLTESEKMIRLQLYDVNGDILPEYHYENLLG